MGFGIVQILSGNDVGPTPTIAAYGTFATIVDFEEFQDKLLGITVQIARWQMVLEFQPGSM